MSRYLPQALTALRSAEVLAGQGDAIGACNRAYYACFDAARALLSNVARIDVAIVRTHRGVAHLFEINFVKTKVFDRDLATALNQTHELRSAGDYSLQSPSLDEARRAIEDASRFVAECERLLGNRSDDP